MANAVYTSWAFLCWANLGLALCRILGSRVACNVFTSQNTLRHRLLSLIHSTYFQPCQVLRLPDDFKSASGRALDAVPLDHYVPAVSLSSLKLWRMSLITLRPFHLFLPSLSIPPSLLSTVLPSTHHHPKNVVPRRLPLAYL